MNEWGMNEWGMNEWGMNEWGMNEWGMNEWGMSGTTSSSKGGGSAYADITPSQTRPAAAHGIISLTCP
jgi:hypothetical protein